MKNGMQPAVILQFLTQKYGESFICSMIELQMDIIQRYLKIGKDHIKLIEIFSFRK